MKRIIILTIFAGIFLNTHAVTITVERLTGDKQQIGHIRSIRFLPANSIQCTSTQGIVEEVSQVRTITFDDSSLTAVEDIQSQPSVCVYPNPTSSALIVDNVQPNTEMTIYTIGGQTVMSQWATDGTNTINVSHLPDGIYLLQLSNDTFKFIKQQ